MNSTDPFNSQTGCNIELKKKLNQQREGNLLQEFAVSIT